VTLFYQTGTASIDLSKPDDYRVGCVFGCENPHDLTKPMLKVELNMDRRGELHAVQDHKNQSQRVQRVVHLDCYAAWYEKTYETPFTLTPDGI
jgi:hypothetical protein